jgi:hypothetical protein
MKDGMFFIENENGRTYKSLHRTSLVMDFEIKDKILIVQTLNSTYKYEMLEGSSEEFISELSKTEGGLAKSIQGERMEKFMVYMAQSIDGWSGPVVLPRPMDWDEATTYIRKKPMLVGPDALAYRLLMGIKEESQHREDNEAH